MANYSVLSLLSRHCRYLKTKIDGLEDTYHWDLTDEEDIQRQEAIRVYQAELDWISQVVTGIRDGELCLKRGLHDKQLDAEYVDEEAA